MPPIELDESSASTNGASSTNSTTNGMIGRQKNHRANRPLLPLNNPRLSFNASKRPRFGRGALGVEDFAT